jgi:hypothetical protein
LELAAFGIGGLFFAALWGCLAIWTWHDLLSHSLDWPVSKLLLFSLGILPSIGLILAGLIRCPAIVVRNDGLMIKSCFFFWFFVPWEDVLCVLGSKSSKKEEGAIGIRRGLTFLHFRFPWKGLQGWQWVHFIGVSSAGEGYHELVSVITQHVGEAQG